MILILQNVKIHRIKRNVLEIMFHIFVWESRPRFAVKFAKSDGQTRIYPKSIIRDYLLYIVLVF